VAKRAGVGVASIYRRFGNKNDLTQELAERRAQESGDLRTDATGSLILRLSMALQSVAGLDDAAEHEKAISIVLDGLRAR
jgi:AcrR family transcriptional regulator